MLFKFVVGIASIVSSISLVKIAVIAEEAFIRLAGK